MNEIIAIVEAKPAMKVLCAVPFHDKTITELDISSQGLGVEGALVIRRYLKNNGALAKCDLTNNDIPFSSSGVFQELASLWANRPQLQLICQEGNSWSKDDRCLEEQLFAQGNPFINDLQEYRDLVDDAATTVDFLRAQSLSSDDKPRDVPVVMVD